MEQVQTSRQRVSVEAIAWFLQLQNPDHKVLDRRAFSEWLMRSPLHIEEYLAISFLWGAMAPLEYANYSTESLVQSAKSHGDRNNVVTLQRFDLSDTQMPRHGSERRVTRRHWIGLAASWALGATSWLGYTRWHHLADYETAVGMQRTVMLPDESMIILNTNSEIHVEWTAAERRIELVRGEARFHVAKNPSRPFVVATGGVLARALGTTFNVRMDPIWTQVAVLEGRVELSIMADSARASGSHTATHGSDNATGSAWPTPTDVQLVAGERAAVTAGRIELNVGPPIDVVAAWTDRRLIFRDESLTEVVREFNRYRVAPLVIDDPQLAALKINGVFDLDDPESLVEYLRVFEAVQVIRSQDDRVHLIRNAAVQQ